MRIVGVVVAIDQFSGFRSYTIDDSSGACIETLEALPAPSKAQAKDARPGDSKAANKGTAALVPPPDPTAPLPVDVGSVVDVKGHLSSFRDEKQIRINQLKPVRSTSQEVQLWEKRAQFHRDILDKPWVLSESDIRRARRRAKRDEAETEGRMKRLHAPADRGGLGTRGASKATGAVSRSEKDRSKQRGTALPANLKDIIQHAEKGKYNALGL